MHLTSRTTCKAALVHAKSVIRREEGETDGVEPEDGAGHFPSTLMPRAAGPRQAGLHPQAACGGHSVRSNGTASAGLSREGPRSLPQAWRIPGRLGRDPVPRRSLTHATRRCACLLSRAVSVWLGWRSAPGVASITGQAGASQPSPAWKFLLTFPRKRGENNACFTVGGAQAWALDLGRLSFYTGPGICQHVSFNTPCNP